MDIVASICVGALVGAVSGIATLFLLRAGLSKNVSFKSISLLVGETLALPAFWFGGSWLSKEALGEIHFAENFSYYILSLSVVYLVLSVVWLFLFIGTLQGKKSNTHDRPLPID
ncbi:MAG: hypothetical protein P8017_18845 [Deltaproteobacteria bacterium]|jgi:hypothetical protein